MGGAEWKYVRYSQNDYIVIIIMFIIITIVIVTIITLWIKIMNNKIVLFDEQFVCVS